MEPDEVTRIDAGGVSSQRIGLHIALSLNLEAIRAAADTALYSVMTAMDFNKDNRGDRHGGANPDGGRGDLASGRTEAEVFVI